MNQKILYQVLRRGYVVTQHGSAGGPPAGVVCASGPPADLVPADAAARVPRRAGVNVAAEGDGVADAGRAARLQALPAVCGVALGCQQWVQGQEGLHRDARPAPACNQLTKWSLKLGDCVSAQASVQEEQRRRADV